MLTITFNETYQLFYLKHAINELLNDVDNNITMNKITIDHKNGCNNINNKIIPVTFPLYILNYLNNLDKQKKIYDYNFIGTISKKREWVNKYKKSNSVIKKNNYGRNKDTKYNIDEDYYNILCKSKFTLAPTGDCPWSYRFFEAIMCLSIPILENNSNDIYAKDYFHYYDNEEHIYNIEKAIANYNKFIKSNHFLKNIVGLNN